MEKKNNNDGGTVQKKVRNPRVPKLWEACISFLGLILVMSLGIAVFHAAPHIPMFIGVIIAAVMALHLGYRWETVEKMMVNGITKAMQSILILAIVGMMVGVWLLCGTIPTMIYYGLKILSPKIFLLASVLICSITSLATGTSWGTMGTMGLALMGIGHGLGMPVGPTAGAIISGAYFGDKMSPLSDTTNLAPAMAGTDVFTHVKYMMKSTIVAYGITIIFFTAYGFMTASGNGADTSQVTALTEGIANTFHVNPLLFLPPLVVILAIAFHVPAIPGITLGLLVGAVMAPIFQGNLPIFTQGDSGLALSHTGVTFGDILTCAKDGFLCNTKIDALNDLLSTGGLMNMSESILMTIIAMMFGGIMEESRQLEVIINALTRVVKGDAALVGATELTCIMSNIVMPEQYISILIPGRMYAPAYRKKGLHPKCLSNALESAGTVTSPLVPWNTCGMYISANLGVTPFVYGPWAVFNLAMPVVTLVMAVLGITVTKMTAEEQQRADAGELV
ncbi:Na+/H+ antiporter NhaC [Eubacterium pyruvativorans]|uniref:Na+/H+ antiporter NhaC n=1 Tax=Eubacterium pyruvativorans TaxID=155865 RepID=UPI0023F10603|nr:Na+/H+ antiporter NhaC [Eubacterium pyruvativorans]MDD7684272.1 Na+/H+ antiporter NhaC [Eubacterium pyruvativorans]